MFDFFRGSDFRDSIISRASAISGEKQRKIVFADSDDFIIEAASLVKKKRVAQPIILGDSKKILSAFRRLKVSNLEEENIIDFASPQNREQLEKFASEFTEMKKHDGKPISDKDALDKMSRPHYYGAMLVKKGLAHGLVSGASSETKPYYPVFEIVKLAPGVSRASGVFLMVDRPGKSVYFLADCVMNMSPDSEQLAEIATLTAKTCLGFGIEPKVAMLSFSTRDSAKHESVERVKLATAMLKRKHPGMVVDGEIQLDAAVVPEVMQRKCADSPLKGEANVLIFPDLNSGNIGYKLVERLGGYEAIGPFLQGAALPVNDLSRGCSARDVLYVAAVTVIQSKVLEEPHGFSGSGEPEPGHDEESHESHPKPHHAGHGHKPQAHSSGKNFTPLERLPSNVRKIIEDGMKNKGKSSGGDRDSD